MSENIASFLYRVSMYLLFIFAISFFLIMYRSSVTAIEVVKEDLNNDKALYESNFNFEDYHVIGADIISSIIIGLDKDIVVDGVLIRKDEKFNDLLKDEALNSLVTRPNDIYDVKNDINSNGLITRIIFSKR
ncbi:hypothetical protein [Abyssisolibacter fermentans]|uniref:hypothetical protein n=1 Tax=Abyssisolibacter fermentans TaxID=1766203 RepID=UPI00082B31EC|nr:hypothetical protein [Abyssisolibacter fermentans]